MIHHCASCSKQSPEVEDGSVAPGWIIFFEAVAPEYNTLGLLGIFCSMGCANAWTSQAARLAAKSAKKRK